MPTRYLDPRKCAPARSHTRVVQLAVQADFTEETKAGIEQPTGVWFSEPVVEMAIRSDKYDREITVLHLEDRGPVHQEEEPVEDSYDQFFRFGQDSRR